MSHELIIFKDVCVYRLAKIVYLSEFDFELVELICENNTAFLLHTMGGHETGCGKFALRALSQCLAREFQPQGVHVAHVIIDGVIGPPRFVSSVFLLAR